MEEVISTIGWPLELHATRARATIRTPLNAHLQHELPAILRNRKTFGKVSNPPIFQSGLRAPDGELTVQLEKAWAHDT